MIYEVLEKRGKVELGQYVVNGRVETYEVREPRSVYRNRDYDAVLVDFLMKTMG